MKRIACWIVCWLALGAGLLYAATYHEPAAPAATLEQDKAAPPSLSDAECQAVVDHLPEDAGGWHTSVFTHVRLTAREREILDWFVSDPQLSRLRSQTLFHHYNQSMGVWPRYANLTGAGLPVVVVQDATGKVIYKASGEQIPRAPWPLVKGIVECIRAHCPHCPRPRPKPEPEPEPDDVYEPDDKPVVPDVVGPNDNTPLDAKDDTLLAVVLVFLLAVAGGFIATWRGQNNRLL